MIKYIFTVVFTLGVADVVFGFGITALSIKIGTLPQSMPTLFKCGKACLSIALNIFNKRNVEKAYWKDTCTPHSVGMCLLLTRVEQCYENWNTKLSSAHPLYKLGQMNRQKKDDESSNNHLCESIPSYTNVIVSRASSGMLTCPKDNNKIKSYGHDEEMLNFDAARDCWKPNGGPMYNWKRRRAMCIDKAGKKLPAVLNKRECYTYKGRWVEGSPSCASLPLKRGCELVHEKMVALQQQQQQCRWSKIPVKGGNQMLSQCLSLFNCYDPTEDVRSSTELQLFKLTPERLMDTLRKHINSVDYLGDSTEPLVAPEQASKELMDELLGLMDKSVAAENDKLATGVMCRHDWKTSPQRLFRSPMWSGRCIDWRPDRKIETKNRKAKKKWEKNLASASLFTNIMPFTLDGDDVDVDSGGVGGDESKSMNKLPDTQQRRRRLLKQGGIYQKIMSLGSSKSKAPAETTAEKIADTSVALDKIWNEKVGAFISEGWKTSSAQKVVSASRAMRSETSSSVNTPRYFNGDGDEIALKPGMIFNRGLLLADMLGASSMDVTKCRCHCCFSSDKKIKFAVQPVCRPIPAGVVFNIQDEKSCTSMLCAEQYPQTCPTDTEFKSGIGYSTATYEEEGKSSFTGSLTCEETAKRADSFIKGIDRQDPLSISNRIKYWVNQHARSTAMSSICDMKVDMTAEENALNTFIQQKKYTTRLGSALLTIDYEKKELILHLTSSMALYHDIKANQMMAIVIPPERNEREASVYAYPVKECGLEPCIVEPGPQNMFRQVTLKAGDLAMPLGFGNGRQKKVPVALLKGASKIWKQAKKLAKQIGMSTLTKKISVSGGDVASHLAKGNKVNLFRGADLAALKALKAKKVLDDENVQLKATFNGPLFIQSDKMLGKKESYNFKMGDEGLGYYFDAVGYKDMIQKKGVDCFDCANMNNILCTEKLTPIDLEAKQIECEESGVDTIAGDATSLGQNAGDIMSALNGKAL